MPCSFRFLDNVALADLAFEAVGDSIEEVFNAATQAVIETMASSRTIGTSWERAIERSDRDLPELLFDWLSDIVYWKDAAGVVFHDAPLTITKEAERWVLKARLIGALVDPTRQELRNDVKGITKHLYELKQDGASWRVRVVLDV